MSAAAQRPAPALPRWWGRAGFTFSVVGLGLAAYLTADHFSGTTPTCAAFGIVDCAKVTTSPQSELLGVPVALLGLLYFVAMTAANWPALWRSASRRILQVRVGLAAAGMGFVLYLLSMELFVVKAICLWCTGVHVVTFVLFALVLATWPALSERAPAPA